MRFVSTIDIRVTFAPGDFAKSKKSVPNGKHPYVDYEFSICYT